VKRHRKPRKVWNRKKIHNEHTPGVRFVGMRFPQINGLVAVACYKVASYAHRKQGR
jgi:hypothetical protein